MYIPAINEFVADGRHAAVVQACTKYNADLDNIYTTLNLANMSEIVHNAIRGEISNRAAPCISALENKISLEEEHDLENIEPSDTLAEHYLSNAQAIDGYIQRSLGNGTVQHIVDSHKRKELIIACAAQIMYAEEALEMTSIAEVGIEADFLHRRAQYFIGYRLVLPQREETLLIESETL